MSADLVTVLAEGTFEEQIVEISAFLSRSHAEASRNDFVTQFQQLSLDASAGEEQQQEASDDVQKKQAVVQKLVSEFKGLGEGTDRELEGVYNLVSTLISTYFAEDADQSQALFKTLVAAVSKDAGSSSDNKNSIRYRVLSNMFNILPASSPIRLDLFTALLHVASVNDDMDYLSSALTSLPQWLAQWQVSESAKADCLQNVAKALESAEKEHGQTSKAYQFLLLHLRYISTIASGEAKTEAAQRTVSAALGLPKLYEFEDLLQIKAVLDLNGEPIFDLLKIFVGGSTKDFTSWASSNASTLTTLQLEESALLNKIRLLDLADLCAQSVSSDVAYTEIAKVLNVSEDEVETWVIDVIRAGLVSGKLSQVKQTFRVYKSVNRQFGKQQWQQLEQRLVQWQTSINAIIDSIAATRAGQSQTALTHEATAAST